MDELECRAFAKINLSLDVTGTREDGYHTVRMIMQNIRIFDRIVLKKTREPGISMTSDAFYLPVDSSNLMVKAAELMTRRFELKEGLQMSLQKYIPVAAGLGGGSADAAAVLYGMNRLFDLRLSVPELQKIGLKIGADVPFCLMRKAALAEGIGEVLTPVRACPECSIVIAKPPVSVSTKEIYQKLRLTDKTVHPDTDGMLAALERQELPGVASRLGNVLEPVTASEYPEISRIKASLLEKGALNAAMSGSGPTVFGIFDDPEKAERAVLLLRAERDARTVRAAAVLR